PSQSSSSPLHISGTDPGVTLGAHTMPSAPRHSVVPLAQTPARPVEHDTPAPGPPWSGVPSQSSATPLQTSGWLASAEPPGIVEQRTEPSSAHSRTPAPQAPRPVHAPPTSRPFSGSPSQS